MHGPNSTPYNPDRPTGGGNFNPGIKIATSRISIAPPLPPGSFTGGMGGGPGGGPGGGGMGYGRPRIDPPGCRCAEGTHPWRPRSSSRRASTASPRLVEFDAGGTRCAIRSSGYGGTADGRRRS